MKTITMLSFAAVLTGIAAAETPAAPATPAPATPAASPQAVVTVTPVKLTKPSLSSMKEAEVLMTEMLTTLDDLSTALEGVTDKASADAAAPKVAELGANVQALQVKSEQMGEPTPELQQEILKRYSKPLEESVGKFLQASMKVGMANFYGSEALSKAFESLGSTMSGDDESEDEIDEDTTATPAPAPAPAPAKEAK